MSRPDGGPAFPVALQIPKHQGAPDSWPAWTNQYLDGMTLRDYFAAHHPRFDRFFNESDEGYLARLVPFAYAYADAMIAERGKDLLFSRVRTPA